jgi:hypothetical protein
VNAFFLLYALTISLELVLSLVMALFIFLIVAPRGAPAPEPEPAPARRPLANSSAAALADAFVTISNGRDDFATIVHARQLLARTLERSALPQRSDVDAHAEA